jgi:hypothetical protein
MIDFTKILIPVDYTQSLMTHPDLSFERNVNEDSGAINTNEPRCAVYNGMKFEVHPSGRAVVMGSWHKLHHDGKNYEPFTFSQFAQSVQMFCELFSLPPSELRLLQMEFGINFQPSMSAKELIRTFVCNSKGAPFAAMRSNRGKSLGIVCTLTEYSIKIYDKGNQYSLPFELVRFEQKVTCGKYIRRMGIVNLSDLLLPEVWHQLSTELIKMQQALIMREPSIKSELLTTKRRLFIANAGNPIYWQQLSPKERLKAKNMLAEYVHKFGTADQKNELKTTFQQTFDRILPDLKKGYVFPEVLPHRNDERQNEKRVRLTCSINYGKHSQVDSAIDDHSERKCATCGRDIVGQKKGSKFCSEKLFGKAAKKCRNIDSNPRNNYSRAIMRIERDPLLFDHTPYLKIVNF